MDNHVPGRSSGPSNLGADTIWLVMSVWQRQGSLLVAPLVEDQATFFLCAIHLMGHRECSFSRSMPMSPQIDEGACPDCRNGGSCTKTTVLLGSALLRLHLESRFGPFQCECPLFQLDKHPLHVLRSIGFSSDTGVSFQHTLPLCRLCHAT